MICAGVEVILPPVISPSFPHWTEPTILQVSAHFRLTLQQFHSPLSTASTFIPLVRITKDNLIKVKSRGQQQEGGCGVYWVFLC